MAEGGSKFGYWGPVTSNIDWCESNYEMTFYVAEFWNTISNISMISLSLVGAIETWRQKQIEFHFVLPFIALIAVGFGSVLFHMSLLYHLQLFDEMPMIWGTATIVYCVHELNKSWQQVNIKLAILLFFCCLISTVSYLTMDNRLIFEGTYGAMVIYSVILFAIHVYRHDRSALPYFLMANFFYGTALVFWITDRVHCSKLQEFRKTAHPSLHPFSQFHAVWHLLVGLGSHCYLILLCRSRLALLSKPYHLRFKFGCLPYYDSVSAAEQGDAKLRSD